MDPYCKDTAWDGMCVGECIDSCGQDCSVPEPVGCGDTKCEAIAGEYCDTCEADCGCKAGDVCLFTGACCTPSCTGKVCGDDGCGGSCGVCEPGLGCLEGACVPPTCKGSCGDSSPFGCYCDAACFDYGDCCADVCSVCPDYKDLIGTTPLCPDLSKCGDGTCNAEVFENCTNCVKDCGCKAGDVCLFDTCCTPSCTLDNLCQDDGCGGVCDLCKEGLECVGGKCTAVNNDPGCVPTPTPGCDGCACEQCVFDMDPYCEATAWDGLCVSECIDQCGQDCSVPEPVGCGDTKCEAIAGEYCDTCEADCGCKAGDVCLFDTCCTPSCTKETNCMDDGCGGLCNLCAEGFECLAGKCGKPVTGPGCEPSYEPTCGGCECEACVCAMDSYCCNTAWDGICVGECTGQCGGCKVADLPTCGDGTCDPFAGEYCDTCEDDCGCKAGDVCTMMGVCCTSTCGDKECGDDGCGGVCGQCGEGTMCMDGFCIEVGPGCLATDTPGCGGCPCEECVFAMDPYCANTAWDEICVDECMNACGGCAVILPNCGNGTCDTAEGENCKFCEEDCGCGKGETCTKTGECCMPNCEGKPCGDDGCGGQCGPCGPGLGCVEGACVPVQGPTDCLGPQAPSAADCEGISDIGCCDSTGRVLYCMNGALYCIDCAGLNPQCGWTAQFNYYDCGTDGSADPANAFPKECNLETTECTPACEGKTCGDDGCGGNCGKCSPDKDCVDGTCTSCEPQCAGKDCGDNGCGGICGVCEGDDTCVEGKCTPPCDPVANCDGKDCGDDGCGGSCGDCATGFECNEGKCTPVCDPVANCEGKACGPDGCGGSCGECDKGATCSDEGTCETVVVEEPATPDVGTEEDIVVPTDDATDTPADEGEEETGGGSSSSCATSAAGNAQAALLLAGLLLAVAALRRRVQI
jgi:hypothetical protein